MTSIPLPKDVIDYIIQTTDISVKISLYNSRTLRCLVFPYTFDKIEDEVLAMYKQIHRDRLFKCASCFRYHVWDDGTPMKGRQRHLFKKRDIELLRTRIVREK